MKVGCQGPQVLISEAITLRGLRKRKMNFASGKRSKSSSGTRRSGGVLSRKWVASSPAAPS